MQSTVLHETCFEASTPHIAELELIIKVKNRNKKSGTQLSVPLLRLLIEKSNTIHSPDFVTGSYSCLEHHHSMGIELNWDYL